MQIAAIAMVIIAFLLVGLELAYTDETDPAGTLKRQLYIWGFFTLSGVILAFVFRGIFIFVAAQIILIGFWQLAVKVKQFRDAP